MSPSEERPLQSPPWYDYCGNGFRLEPNRYKDASISIIATPAFLLWVGALCYAAMAVVLVRHRKAPGAAVTAFAMGACLVYVVGALLNHLVTDLSQQILAMNLGYVGLSLTPVAILGFVAFYARDRPIHWRRMKWLLVVPVLSICLVWTNAQHELMWTHPPVDANGALTVRADWGPWFRFVHLPYQWVLVVLADLCLLQAALRSTGTRHGGAPRVTRGQALTLFTGLTAVFLVNIYTVLGPEDFPASPTAVAVALASVLFLWLFVTIELVPLPHVAHRRIVNTMPDPVYVMDASNRVLELNPKAEALLPDGDPVGRRLPELFEAEPQMLALIARSGDVAIELSLTSGQVYDAHLSWVYDSGGHPRGRTLLLRDITERLLHERRLHSIVDASPNGIVQARVQLDDRGAVEDVICTFANAPAAVFLGVEQSELANMRMLEAMPAVGPQLIGVFQRALDEGEDQRVDLPVAGEEDDPLWYRVIVSPLGDELAITFMDVTTEKRREAEMHQVAFLDPLTHALNRRGLERAYDQIPPPGRRGHGSNAVLYTDLDRFKLVNDTYGHAVGDRLLKEFAARLKSATREGDLIARVGGDEFVVVLLDSDLETTRVTVSRLVQVTEAPYWLNGEAVTCTPSIGVSFTSEARTTLAEALVDADRAMYRAKTNGGGAKTTAPQGPASHSFGTKVRRT